MKPNSHPYQKIIQNRGLILRFSYIIAISIIILAFQWETNYEKKDLTGNKKPLEDIVFIPRTIHQEEVKVPEPEPIKESQPEIIDNTTDIEVVDDNKKIEQEHTIFNMEDVLKNPPKPTEEKIVEPVEKYRIVEQMPEFKGGMQAFYKYFQNSYRSKSCTFGAEGGKIHVEFVINEDGNVSDVEILRGICPNIDNEVKRVIESMPAWNPGKQRGKAVKVMYNLPVQIVAPK